MKPVCPTSPGSPFGPCAPATTTIPRADIHRGVFRWSWLFVYFRKYTSTSRNTSVHGNVPTFVSGGVRRGRGDWGWRHKADIPRGSDIASLPLLPSWSGGSRFPRHSLYPWLPRWWDLNSMTTKMSITSKLQ